MTGPGGPALVRGSELLGRSVRWGSSRLGTVVDLFLDAEGGRVVGFEVECTSGGRRFLPLAACEPADEELRAVSPLALLDRGVLGYYRARGISFLALCDADGRPGPVEDVVVGAEGSVEAFVPRAGRELRQIRPGRVDLSFVLGSPRVQTT